MHFAVQDRAPVRTATTASRSGPPTRPATWAPPRRVRSRSHALTGAEPQAQYPWPVDVRGQGIKARSRTRRLAAVVGLVAAALLAPPAAGAARSEFYGIVQTATLDNQDIQGIRTARVRTDRFVLKWGWIQTAKDIFKWKSSDQFFGSSGRQRDPRPPVHLGQPRLGARAPPHRRRSAGRRSRTSGESSCGRWWRATGPAAPTGRARTTSGSARTPSRCRSRPGRSGTSPT